MEKKSLAVIRKLLLSNVAPNDFNICNIYGVEDSVVLRKTMSYA